MSPAGSTSSRPVLLLAEFETPDQIIGAAQRVRNAGYRKWDVHTPYPVHGMDAAMGLSDSRLGWIVFASALAGLLGAVVMMQWMNGYDYPLVIGGKPPEAYASMVPIMFELTVLFSAITAFLGMLVLNGFPRLHHPVFASNRFRRATIDRFFEAMERAERPVLLHCATSNRVGALYYAWLVLEKGVEPKAALERGKAAGLRSPELIDKVDKLIAERRPAVKP